VRADLKQVGPLLRRAVGSATDPKLLQDYLDLQRKLGTASAERDAEQFVDGLWTSLPERRDQAARNAERVEAIVIKLRARWQPIVDFFFNQFDSRVAQMKARQLPVVEDLRIDRPVVGEPAGGSPVRRVTLQSLSISVALSPGWVDDGGHVQGVGIELYFMGRRPFAVHLDEASGHLSNLEPHIFKGGSMDVSLNDPDGEVQLRRGISVALNEFFTYFVVKAAPAAEGLNQDEIRK